MPGGFATAVFRHAFDNQSYTTVFRHAFDNQSYTTVFRHAFDNQSYTTVFRHAFDNRLYSDMHLKIKTHTWQLGSIEPIYYYGNCMNLFF